MGPFADSVHLKGFYLLTNLLKFITCYFKPWHKDGINTCINVVVYYRTLVRRHRPSNTCTFAVLSSISRMWSHTRSVCLSVGTPAASADVPRCVWAMLYNLYCGAFQLFSEGEPFSAIVIAHRTHVLGLDSWGSKGWNSRSKAESGEGFLVRGSWGNAVSSPSGVGAQPWPQNPKYILDLLRALKTRLVAAHVGRSLIFLTENRQYCKTLGYHWQNP